MSSKNMSKQFKIVYKATVERVAYVNANDEEEARRAFERGDYIVERDTDCYDVELIKVIKD